MDSGRMGEDWMSMLQWLQHSWSFTAMRILNQDTIIQEVSRPDSSAVK